MAELSPKKQLDGFIAKFDPAIAAHTKKVLAAMRKRLPGALELVYDNYNALAVGFAPTERASDVKGSGNTVRHIVLKDAGTLDDPDVSALMGACLKIADPPLDPKQKYRLIIKSISTKQRPRRTK